MTNFLAFILVNLHSLLNKVQFVADFCFDNDVGIFGICESWLIPSISDSSIGILGYKLFRGDSPSGVRKHGVCLYIRDSIRVGTVVREHPNTVGLFLSSFRVWVLLVYRPPSYSLQESIMLLSFLDGFCRDREVVIMGDFNLPRISWTGPVPVASASLEARFVELFALNGLKQWILQPTFIRSDNVLDLVLTSEEDRVSDIGLLDPPPGCDHLLLKFN